MSIRGAAVPAPYEIQPRRELEMRRAFTDEGWQIWMLPVLDFLQEALQDCTTYKITAFE